MFQEIPASKNSISSRKLTLGVGINDADYVTNPKINGKRSICPFYVRWTSMLGRCYSDYYQSKFPTYVGCTVAKEWLTFSNFKAWMIKQDWQDKHLDKDILHQGNKIYSPRHCIFVSQKINKLFNEHYAARGEYQRGVSLDKHRGKFVAKIRSNGNTVNLGRFASEESAYKAYKKAKYNYILTIANEQKEPLRSALLAYKIY